MKRDAFGFIPLYRGREHHAESIRALFAKEPSLSRALDRVTVTAHLDGRSLNDRSFFAEVRPAPPSLDLVTPARSDLGASLRAAMRRIFETARRPVAVATSGGLDSAIVLALAREIDRDVIAIVLAPELDGYTELDAALATARALDVRTHVVTASADDFRDALPNAIAAMEVSIYNLHPVSKWLLAKGAREAGFATVVSGDAADHVFTRDVSANYLPLVYAAFADHGVAIVTPFLDDDVIAHVLSSAPDAEKRELRDVGASLPIPQALVTEKKASRLAPPIELAGLVDPARIPQLAASLDLAEPDLAGDRARVRWTTLALLADAAARWP